MLFDLNQLVAGAHERNYLNTPDIQLRTVGKYLPFDTFHKGDRHKHDIAILKTNEPFQLNRLFVRTISLPPTRVEFKGNNCNLFTYNLLSIVKLMLRKEKFVKANGLIAFKFYN